MLRSIIAAIEKGDNEELLRLMEILNTDSSLPDEQKKIIIQSAIRAALNHNLTLTPLVERQYFVKFDSLDALLSTVDANIRVCPDILADIINRTQGDLSIIIRERLLRLLSPATETAVRGVLVASGKAVPATPMPLAMFNKFMTKLSQGGELSVAAADALKKCLAELMRSELKRGSTSDFFFLRDLWKVTIQVCRRDLNGTTAGLLYLILSEIISHNPQADKRVRVMHHIYAFELGVRLGKYQAALVQLDRVSLLNSQLEDDQRITRACLPQLLMVRLSLLFCNAAKVEQPIDEKKQYTETWPNGSLRIAVQALRSLQPIALTDECIKKIGAELPSIEIDCERFQGKVIKKDDDQWLVNEAQHLIYHFYEWLIEVETKIWPNEQAIEQCNNDKELTHLQHFLEINLTLLQCIAKAADELDKTFNTGRVIVDQTGKQHELAKEKIHRIKELLAIRTAKAKLITEDKEKNILNKPTIYPLLLWAIKTHDVDLSLKLIREMDPRFWLLKKEATTLGEYLAYFIALYGTTEELLVLLERIPVADRSTAVSTALFTAAPDSRHDMVAALVSLGIAGAASDYHLSAFHGKWPEGATSEAAMVLDKVGRLPLEWAVSGGHKRTVTRLLSLTPRSLVKFFYLLERAVVAKQLELLPLIMPHVTADELEDRIPILLRYIKRRYDDPVKAINTILVYVKDHDERLRCLRSFTLNALRAGYVDIMLGLISLRETDLARIEMVAYLLRYTGKVFTDFRDYQTLLPHNCAAAGEGSAHHPVIEAQTKAYAEASNTTDVIWRERVIERLGRYIGSTLEKYPEQITSIILDFTRADYHHGMSFFFREVSPAVMQRTGAVILQPMSSFKDLMDDFINNGVVTSAAVATFLRTLKTKRLNQTSCMELLHCCWTILTWCCETQVDKVDFKAALHMTKTLTINLKYTRTPDFLKVACLAIAAGDYAEALSQFMRFVDVLVTTKEYQNAYLLVPRCLVAKHTLVLMDALKLTLSPQMAKFQREKWHKLADNHYIAMGILPGTVVTEITEAMLVNLNEQLAKLKLSSYVVTKEPVALNESYTVNPIAVMELFGSFMQIYGQLIAVERHILQADVTAADALAKNAKLQQLFYTAAQTMQPTLNYSVALLARFANEVGLSLQVTEDAKAFIKRTTDFHQNERVKQEQERKAAAERRREAEIKKREKRQRAEERKAEERNKEEARKNEEAHKEEEARKEEERRMAEARKQAEERKRLAQEKKEEERKQAEEQQRLVRLKKEEERKQAQERKKQEREEAEKRKQAEIQRAREEEQARKKAEEQARKTAEVLKEWEAARQAELHEEVGLLRQAETDYQAAWPLLFKMPQLAVQPDLFAPIPQAIINILRIFNNNGDVNCPIALLVGGAVRDCLMGRTPGNDFDIAVYMQPEKLETFLKDRFGEQNVVAEKNFLTVKKDDCPTTWSVNFAGYKIDFSAIKPETSYHEDIKKDAQSRDFTCNAIYWHPDINIPGQAIKQILDPLKGYKDIKSRTLRFCLPDRNIFAHHATRVFRALRFRGREFKFKFDQMIELSFKHCAEEIKQIPHRLLERDLRNHYAKLSASLGDETNAELEKYALLEGMQAKGIVAKASLVLSPS